ncbi:MsnO8 family LLM class oxidoreductase [Actinoplanes sp. TBRC 11911]|uniref:MsnO8 family LLM class oxidoreductase n=1 Tax=Actinoplanes sp. TBRC 11911 TaxID=2729386 RepID=UPI00145E4B59|nr:MsnO8 family LLM class oxidoreductase [Actinoplanes sp. TBRC 11911]NMO55336.1 MsnO8 family LLM class oxidoreductase [Actinoplanes sp. TBRC 11911]
MIDVQISALEVLGTDNRHDTAAVASGLAQVAQAVEAAGYDRIWYAEHHRSPSAVDFPPPVMVAHIAAATSRIRVGSGGVMAPNHAPVIVGEQFRSLERLYPGRVDLGIGRGPGTPDTAYAKAMRWGGDPATDGEYRAAVKIILDDIRQGPTVPQPWLLASSTNGALLAAELGLPMAFAYHIRPHNAAEAIDRYREAFSPSEWSTEPRVQLSVTVACADTEERAAALIRPIEIVMAGVMTGSGPREFLDPELASRYAFTSSEQDALRALRGSQVHGAPDAVASQLDALVSRFAADEMTIFCPIVNPSGRIRSYQLVATQVPAASSAVAR